MVLIGAKNEINDKLMSEISQVMPVEFCDVTFMLSDEFNTKKFSTSLVVLNLIGIHQNESLLLATIQKKFSNCNIIATHTFENQRLIDDKLGLGYDGYISIFNFTEDITGCVQKLSFPASNHS